MNSLLPATREEMLSRGWDHVDVVLVTGDAYVDHPSFGIAIIGRVLEAHGFRVAVLAQPRHDSPEDFKRFGRPRLFFGISAGNLDSICANYTSNARVRDKDAYSPGGNPYWGKVRKRQERRRPDRAVIRYAQLAREAYGDVTIVLGGIEASLRRFVHYDYQSDKIRSSVLTDAKADILVYGMGERQVVEIARRLSENRGLWGIPGTALPAGRGKAEELLQKGTGVVVLPSYNEIILDKRRFIEAELLVDGQSKRGSKECILQEQKSRWVIQFPPPQPLTQRELDEIYELPFTRMPHPLFGHVPAFDAVAHSVVAVRGCPGNCSFCAINRHQGPEIHWRSMDSIIREVERIARSPGFKGTISDVGGPTANLYGVRCKRPCKRRDCLYPKVCKNLDVREGPFLELLKGVQGVKGVRHVFVSSGLRMELLLKTPGLCRAIFTRHMPGRIKIAPEHTEDHVLGLMHKPGRQVLEEFLRLSRSELKPLGIRPRFSAYFISAHPGCSLEDMEMASRRIRSYGLSRVEVQDFTPTPGTISTAMYVSCLGRDDLRPIYVAKKRKERLAMRRVLEQILEPKLCTAKEGKNSMNFGAPKR